MSNDNTARAEIQATIFRELLNLSPGNFRIYSRYEAEVTLGAGTIQAGIERDVHVAPDEHGPPVPLRIFPLADEGGRVVIMRPREEDLT